MKTQAELTELLDFIGEYATYLLGSGVHTSRVVRNARRIGASQSVDVRLTTFQRTSILTVREEGNPQVVTQVVEIPHLPISFERNSDLSSLSWEAVDRRLPLDVIREKFRKLTAKPRMDPMFVLMVVGLANASFCKLFNGDWVAVGIVFTSTLAGFSARSLCASSALRFDCTAETAIATSVLFLVPGVPLINGVIDIVEGHVLIGCSRLIGALLLILCIAVGLSVTLLMVKGSLL